MAKTIKKPRKRGDISFAHIPEDRRLVQRSDMPLTSVRNLIKQGVPLPTPEETGAIFGEFDSAVQYQDMMNVIVKAQESFDALPSHIRDRFKNDPRELLEFIDDEDNLDEAIELGIIDEQTALRKQTDDPESHSKGRKTDRQRSDDRPSGNSPDNGVDPQSSDFDNDSTGDSEVSK